MSQPPHPNKQDAASRAQELASYLEEKCIFPNDMAHYIKPQSLQSDIEAVLIEAEQVVQELQEKK